MANEGNEKRARDFIAKAVELRGKASPREQMWIDAWAGFLKEGQDDKARRRAYVRALARIVKTYPDDVEAKAFHALQIWEDGFHDIPIFSRRTLDAEMRQVLAKNPLHPLHHYIIHLWNDTKDENALTSAAMCGPSEPGIAHMWHMPGHTYSALKRYADAAWQQEASARVDHFHMIHDWVIPDQIHNYAHNNQWLVEDLLYIGRVHDAVDLAKNMIELPMHPAYNTTANGNSYMQGRRRLFQGLMDYELWDDLIALSVTLYLPPTVVKEQQWMRLYALGVAYGEKRDSAGVAKQIQAIEPLLKAEHEAKDASAAPNTDPRKQSDQRIKTLEGYLAELRGYQATIAGRNDEAHKHFEKADSQPKWRRAKRFLSLGDKNGAEKLAREAVNDQQNQVQPLANLVDILQACGKRDDAQVEMRNLQKIAAYVDLDAPIFHRLTPVAHEMGLSDDWRPAPEPAKDLGPRPPLDSLGPFRWSPPSAPNWVLRDADGKRISLSDYRDRGRAVLMLFYLGAGCSQCMEQLNTFAPEAKDFEAAGISVVAIGTDSSASLKKATAHAKADSGFPFPLLSDYDLKVFKAYRAYDDFEKMPLHAAILIDRSGRVRWQDTGSQPFMDTKFLLEESKRLLQIDLAAGRQKLAADERK